MTTRAATPIERSVALDFFFTTGTLADAYGLSSFFVISTMQAAIGQASHLLA